MTESEAVAAGATGEEAVVVADAVEAARQRVQQESADELVMNSLASIDGQPTGLQLSDLLRPASPIWSQQRFASMT